MESEKEKNWATRLFILYWSNGNVMCERRGLSMEENREEGNREAWREKKGT